VKNRTGSGRISATGGNGFAGGGGERVSIHVFSRHHDTQIFVHGENQIIILLFCFLISRERFFLMNRSDRNFEYGIQRDQ
jgi:hypothetical protein